MTPKARTDERRALLTELLSRPDGRRLLWWLLTISRAVPGAENPFRNNALATSFHCGEQNVGQQVLAETISASPDGYIKMLKEDSDDSRQRDAERRTAARRYDTGAGSDDDAGNAGAG